MIKLWKSDPPGYDPALSDEIPGITPYLLNSGKSHGAVIVFPGGGYAHRAEHEGEPIARWLNGAGLSAFVLDYRVAPYKYPYPLMDAKRAIRYVRYKAPDWNIDQNRIGILGFSAGGHLVSMAGTLFDEGDAHADDPVDRVSSRPDAMILCYPVITFGDRRHNGSMINLLGENPPDDLRYRLSTENSVSEKTPPSFLWHTADDAAVPVENSIMFAQALSKHKVPFALHIFPHGRHGLGMKDEVPEVAQWPLICESWLRGIGFVSGK